MVHSLEQIRGEIQTLAQLALLTNRSLIIPNVLIGAGTNIPSSIGLRPTKNGVTHKLDAYVLLNQSHACKHKGEFYWPSFRTALNQIESLEVVEPAYYWRILNDFQIKIPEPKLITYSIKHYDKDRKTDDASFFGLVQALMEADDSPRVVIDLRSDVIGPWGPDDLSMWAADSIGEWGEAPIEKSSYMKLPYPSKNIINENVIKQI